MKPEVTGDTTQLITIVPTLPHCTASTPMPTAAKPTIAPTIECVVDTGQPLREAISNPWVAATFLASLAAVALTGADSPNWFALISDVNLPEHRGTIFGLANFANGIGRSAGNGLTGVFAGAFETALPPPLNWAVGLTAFQVFFLPTGYCYYRAAKTSPGDITEVRSILGQRSSEVHRTGSGDD